MSRRYPSVRITPAEVVEFFDAQGQQPSLEDAERWLCRQKRCIEEMMGNVVRNNLQRILGEATVMGYPDPVFDRQYRDIDEAMQTASDEYGERIRMEPFSSAYEEREMLEVVRRMLAHQQKFMACIAYSQEFKKPGDDSEDGDLTHCTKRVHISCDAGTVTAEVVAEDACDHGADVFVPDRDRSTQSVSSRCC